VQRPAGGNLEIIYTAAGAVVDANLAGTSPSSSAFTIDGQRVSDLGELLVQVLLLQHQHQSDFAAANNMKIAEAQEVLKEDGFYSGPLDGIMSERTVDALRSFQQSKHLNITGRIDSETSQELGLQKTRP
jgi:putative peptidoglycan binding protein